MYPPTPMHGFFFWKSPLDYCKYGSIHVIIIHFHLEISRISLEIQRFSICFYFLSEFNTDEFLNIAKTYCEVKEFSSRNALLKCAIQAGMKGGIGGRIPMEVAIENFGRWLFTNKKVMILQRPVENALDMVKVVPKIK